MPGGGDRVAAGGPSIRSPTGRRRGAAGRARGGRVHQLRRALRPDRHSRRDQGARVLRGRLAAAKRPARRVPGQVLRGPGGGSGGNRQVRRGHLLHRCRCQGRPHRQPAAHSERLPRRGVSVLCRGRQDPGPLRHRVQRRTPGGPGVLRRQVQGAGAVVPGPPECRSLDPLLRVAGGHAPAGSLDPGGGGGPLERSRHLRALPGGGHRGDAPPAGHGTRGPQGHGRAQGTGGRRAAGGSGGTGGATGRGAGRACRT